MNKKILIAIVSFVSLASLFYVLTPKDDGRESIIITSSASYIEMDLDYLIKNSDLIVTGSVDIINPSRWNTLDGKLPRETTVHTITPDKVIFTDVIFRIDQTIKGQSGENTIRIRSLGGIVGQDQMTVSGVASLEMGKTYLLFLEPDTGSTADIDPGHYFVRGGLQGVYQVLDGKAISIRDEWLLEDLIAYIQNALQNSQ